MFDTIRRSVTEAFHEGKAASATAILSDKTPPTAEVVFLRRLSFGIAPDGFYQDNDARGDLAKFNAGGATLSERINAWVQDQLNVPNDKERTDVGSFIDNNFSTLNMTVPQEWNRFVRRRGAFEREQNYRPLYEYMALSYTRAVHSRYQLFERLTDFWHDHFNVYGFSFYAKSTWGSWNRVIRQHALGNFYDLLLATATHPAMLYYLDNFSSTVSGPNENYARELIELHTLGAMNYYGVGSQSTTPTYTAADGVPGPWVGKPKGYVDADVYEATRMLTGWSVDNTDRNTDTGVFRYKENNADRFQKNILGSTYEANGNTAAAEFNATRVTGTGDDGKLKQGKLMLWRLATHPGTARHIAWKLVQAFVADEPPADLVDAVTQTFITHSNSNDQLKRCYETLFTHSSMADPQTWGKKKQRPMDMMIHACRSLGAKRGFRRQLPGEANDNTNPKRHEFNQTYTVLNTFMGRAGHTPWLWVPPDGYPQKASHWLGSNSLVNVWAGIDWLADSEDHLLLNDNQADNERCFLPILTETLNALPSADRSPEKIMTYWAKRVWGVTPTAEDLRPYLQFFGKPYPQYARSFPAWPPTSVIHDLTFTDGALDSSPYYWRRKLRVAVVALFSHPYAMLR